MKYYLVTDGNDVHPFKKKIFFYCKRDLLDWISSHLFCLSRFVMNRIFVHRVIKASEVGPRICSLRDYIVKHKLM